MSSGLILAIDQGTTNTKALLVAQSGAPVFRASRPVEFIHTPAGHLAQDPEALWKSVQAVIADCVLYVSQAGASIDALAISNQRETAVAWSAESGKPLANAVSWQCPRSEEICQRLSSHTDVIRAKTGLPLATLLSAGKWAWLLENDGNVQAHARTGTLRFGTVDSWLIHQVTGGSVPAASPVHATDLSNASRTGLLNLERETWDADLLALFGIPPAAMPDLKSSSGSFGKCIGISGLEDVPILSAIGDSHAAMFGHGRYTSGVVKATYGTGSSLMALTSTLPPDTPTLARTIGWSIAGKSQFAIEGNIAMTGSAMQWVGKFLQLKDPARDVVALAAGVPDSHGVYFVPAMVGLGAPHWDATTRGIVCGLGPSHTAAHLARAALEAISFQVADVFFAMEAVGGVSFSALQADGGATRNSDLMQFQANILACPVSVADNEELSALGASWLAGLALEWWKDLEEVATIPRAVHSFLPTMPLKDRDALYAGWKMAVNRARLKPEVEP